MFVGLLFADNNDDDDDDDGCSRQFLFFDADKNREKNKNRNLIHMCMFVAVQPRASERARVPQQADSTHSAHLQSNICIRILFLRSELFNPYFLETECN